MKKVFTFLVILFAMMAASVSSTAQEVTVLLTPGWNWISYPNAEAMQVGDALGGFTPVEGDVIQSQFASSKYINGRWRGGVSQFLPGSGYMYYSARTEDVEFVFAQPASNIVATAMPTDITATSAVAGGMVTLPEGSHVFLRGVCWGTMLDPDIDGDHTSVETGVGVFSSTLEGLTPNTVYHVRAYAVTDSGLAYGEELSFTTLDGGSNGHEYVDLGLPSGNLWATCNVGASAPEEYGDYFAWGETQSKDFYDWSSYQYCNGSSNTLTKYCYRANLGYNGYTDTLTILLPEDDAASANWGGAWYTPSDEDWQELRNNTSRTMTTQNGVNGMLLTAANGNSIFLPCAGYRSESNLGSVGNYGYYWSNMLGTSYPSNACAIYFYNNSGGNIYTDPHFSRSGGKTVRPVRPSTHIVTYEIEAFAHPEECGSVSGGDIYQYGTTCTLSATANEGYTFAYWAENGKVVSTDATYTFIVKGNRNLGAYFIVSSGDHLYVDLGLPSGTLWATCNVGAISPESYGDHFAWGETQPKDYYEWNTYQHCNGSQNTLTKYCDDPEFGYNGFTDDLTILLPEDDAATANWGAAWRMPTRAEWEELFEYTTNTWTDQNGVSGRLITASNGNTLFLPAAGVMWQSDNSGMGGNCFYWSSSLSNGYPASASGFGSFWSIYNFSGTERFYGVSVRPVRSSVPMGAIDGKFTINEDGGQVYFSQGNLQYIGSAATPYWKFADNQWDYLGTTTGQNSTSQNVDRDLFGYGTSGYNHGANCYQPWSTSQTNSDYYAYGSYTYNLYDQTGQADWGYNPISNGGNQTNQWRTLTTNEWTYVFNTRTTSSGIRYAKANVNNVNGVILLPDDWNTSYYTLSNTNSSGASFISNTITASQWGTLEQHGAVFLPAAGFRGGTSVNEVDIYGDYWSASCGNSDYAWYVHFYGSSIYTDYIYSRLDGRSVRLVAVSEN